MPKNIIIFSDGTGQAGGLLPDERRSNVYKLYRATRCGPESNINPAKQLAFYDPGLGSASDGEYAQTGFARKIYNLLSRATGLGITRNMIDCYAAILQMWEPGDRIFFFGFSRGAYTVRCLAGVLGICGVPTAMPDGKLLKRDPRTAREIAKEAVKSVYQHGATHKSEKLAQQRRELARRFRDRYSSNSPEGDANTVPYFIGVWDTVAALGVNVIQQIAILASAFLAFAAIGCLTWLAMPMPVKFWMWMAVYMASGIAAGVIWYVATHLKWATGLSVPWWQTLHMTGWRMKFYDTFLNPRVEYAKHALSIDENRAAFAKVDWTERAELFAGKEAGWFEQVWFAGVHSDVGGSYPENESRLSDISLEWMTERATSASHPLIVDERMLYLFGSPTGIQHDEVKSSRLKWVEAARRIAIDAPLHPSVIQRFKAVGVVQYDEFKPYRPEGLRNHEKVSLYYTKPHS